MAEIIYDIRRGSDVYRMISGSRLQRWIFIGKIKRGETIVWRHGLSGWRRPEALEELSPFFKKWEKQQLEIKRRRKKAAQQKLRPEKQLKDILIIDDEKDLCLLLSDVLSRRGYNVVTTHTTRTGLAAIKSKRPDLVFLDLRLPDGDGLQAISKIKKISPETAVSIISAYGSQEVKEKARQKGVYSFIDKPFSEKEILRSIREVRL